MKKFLPFFILFIAFALRAWQLTSVPPGLTHDEAGHGHDAAYILKGIRPIYFTVGYGREPLFDYLNAGLMAGMCASAFTLRFAAVCWGMIALAATYRAARLAFDHRVALLALVLMAVSFWPLVTSRQALRSAMLPGEMALAVALFLQLQGLSRSKVGSGDFSRPARRKWLLVIGLGLLLAASLYTYIPARALWLIFPLAALINAAQNWNREARFAKGAKQTLISRLTHASLSRAVPDVLRFTHNALRTTQYVFISLLLAFTLASPLFFYLFQHPEAEQRIGMLSEPLAALQNGDPSPLFANARETLLAFFLPGHGDHFLAYTIPGKPLFDPITFLLFLIGLAIFSISLARHLVIPSSLHLVSVSPSLPVYPLLTLWLFLGLAPALVTGPEALTTRIIGAQPILYILPALALSRLMKAVGKWPLRVADSKLPFVVRLSSLGLVSLFIVSLFISSFRDYFFTWA
ncbi:MAG: phospholipid carrier-dependent glycosyltransferase, partial [Chloroflexota bacterium]